MERWKQGHSQADVTVTVAAGLAADDAAADVVAALEAFIKRNPGRCEEWKQAAEAKLKGGDGDEA